MNKSLAGKVAIVTGAAQGIGAGVAEYLASLGAAAALVDIDSKLGMQTERRLRNKGLDVTFWECDLRQTSQVTSLVDRIWSGAGRVDVVVNNAAEHGPRRPILDYSIKDWENVLATNLTGTFWITREVVSRMVAARVEGSIVNIVAIQSQIPISTYAAYVASKGGLEALTRAMAVEFAPHGVRANAVMLGAIYSGSTQGAGGQSESLDTDFEQVPPSMDATVPNLVGRMGRPSDVAKVVAMLASDDSSYLTGSVVVVDGGRMLNRGTDAFSRAATEPVRRALK